MLRWENFLIGDARYDFTVFKNVKDGIFENQRAWQTTGGSFFFGLAVVMGKPTKEEWSVWVQGVRALRSIAGRVAAFRPPKGMRREPGIDPLKADKIMASYVAQLRPTIELNDRPLRKLPRVDLFTNTESLQGYPAAITRHFQFLFSSLLDLEGFNDRTCDDCNREMPRTKKKGLKSQAKICRACAVKRSRSKISRKDRSKIEAERKAKYRRNLKRKSK